VFHWEEADVADNYLQYIDIIKQDMILSSMEWYVNVTFKTNCQWSWL